MSAVRSFQMAATEAIEQRAEEYEPLEYEFVDIIDGKKTTRSVVATYPGDGAMALLQGRAADNPTGELFSFLSRVLKHSDFRFIEQGFAKDKIALEHIMAMVQDMVEEWTSFPTQQPSVSTPSRPRTGTRSTGRAPGAGSTRSSSRQDGS